MSDREEFEESAARLGYNLTMAEHETGEYHYPVTQNAWDIWQEATEKAARAQQGEGREAEIRVYEVLDIDGDHVDWAESLQEAEHEACEPGDWIRPLNTHPDKAQGVPEGMESDVGTEFKRYKRAVVTGAKRDKVDLDSSFSFSDFHAGYRAGRWSPYRQTESSTHPPKAQGVPEKTTYRKVLERRDLHNGCWSPHGIQRYADGWNDAIDAMTTPPPDKPEGELICAYCGMSFDSQLCKGSHEDLCNYVKRPAAPDMGGEK